MIDPPAHAQRQFQIRFVRGISWSWLDMFSEPQLSRRVQTASLTASSPQPLKTLKPTGRTASQQVGWVRPVTLYSIRILSYRGPEEEDGPFQESNAVSNAS